MSYWSGTYLLLPIKYTTSINPEQLPETTSPDFEFEYIDISNVSFSNGVNKIQKMSFQDAPSRARKIVKSGDTIISTVRTYLKSIAYIGEKLNNSIASTGFAVLRPYQKYCSKYLYYTVQSEPFVQQITANSTGVSYPAINPSVLGKIKIPIPPHETQKEIADFLDQEISEIDALVLCKETFLKLLSERKESLFCSVLDGSILEEKELGEMGWFGTLPKSWVTARAKFLFREAKELSVHGDEELLTVSHITGVTKRSEKNVNMFMAETLEGYKLVSKSDVVVNTMWAWMGAMGISQHNGLISPAYGVYRPINKKFNDKYLDLIIRSKAFIAEATRRSKGIHSSRLRLYPDAFLDILLPVPDIETQKKILMKYEDITAKENKLIKLNIQSIETLKELKASLITEAVTGQLDIEAWKNKNTADRRLDKIQEEMAS